MTVVEVFERTDVERMRALQVANEVRAARARVKQELRAGAVTAVELLQRQPSYLASMKISKLLAAIPGIGPSKSRRLMQHVRIADGKTVSGLSDRQRDELVQALEERNRG